MRFGTIDLGTNSVRFDVHQIHPDGSLERIHREKLMVRLGHGVFVNGRLNPAAVRRTIQAFESFRNTAEVLKVSHLAAFGTASLREASDSEDAIRQIFERTTIPVEVISGQDEAELIARGVLANEAIPKGRYMLVDIGGGSTEITICQGRKILHSHSFDLGSARLQQLFLKEHPPGGDAVKKLKSHVKDALRVKRAEEDWPSTPTLIGSSGTIRAVSRIQKKLFDGKRVFGLEAVSKLVDHLRPMTMRELYEVDGLEPKRADIILSGTVLLETIAKEFGVKSLVTSEYSMRDGLIEKERKRLKGKKHVPIPAHRDDIDRFVQRLTPDQSHPHKVEEIALKIFDDLQDLHRLKPRWRFLLSAGALLHDVGESINPVHHSSHSYYVVMNGEFGRVEDWERDLLANLCLLHQSGKIRYEHLEFAAKDKHIDGFEKLLAILRVADSLDRSRKGLVRVDRVTFADEVIDLHLDSDFDIDLEVLRLEQKKEVFETTFDKTLRIWISGELQQMK